MKLHICDFCKNHISDNLDLFISIVISKHGLYGAVEQANLDCCIPCAKAKGLMDIKPILVPNEGRLTEDEINKLID